MGYYMRLREKYHRCLLPLGQSSGRRVLLYGSGEVAEIAALVIWELDLTVEYVVDDMKPGVTFLGQKVRTLAEISDMEFDWLVLAVLNGSEVLKARLRDLGVPDERIVALTEDSG